LLSGAAPPATRLAVFAVEDTTAQITWSALGPGTARFRGAGPDVTLEVGEGPGAVVLEGLAPGRRHEVSVTVDQRPVGRPLRFRTLTPPPGPELCRVATVSDLHIGIRTFGFLATIVERPWPEVMHPVRCATAAIAEAAAWGAGLLIVKGDVTQDGTRAQWADAGRILRAAPMPTVLLPGNHDRGPKRTVEPWVAAPAVGLRMVRGVEAFDHEGLRVVLADSTRPAEHGGRTNHLLADLADGLAVNGGGPTGALLALHHQLQRTPWPEGWPPGVPPWQALPLLQMVLRVRRATFITTGHTHRHRRHRHGPLTITQVGSTKDFPGVWAGYAVHEGGIRQVVRRVSAADCMGWTEHTREAVAGAWPVIGAGRRSDRCLAVTWR
jgi:3',5'-cyclic-AMP phosphodiesterase